MLTYEIKRLPFFKQIILNFQIWQYWKSIAKVNDTLAIDIMRKYSFFHFMTIHLFS